MASCLLALTALAIAALGACGVTADFSGLQGGARDAGSESDGANLEAGDPHADAGKGFCASQPVTPKLCADFDEGQPVDTGWTLRDVSDNATVAIDTVAATPPGAMLSAIVTADAPGFARLEQALPVRSTHVRIEFKMLLPTGGGPFELCALHEVAPDGTNYGFFYKQEEGNLLVYLGTLGDDGGLAQYVYRIGAPPAAWLHVEIDIDIADAGNVLVKHDGMVVVNATNVPTATFGRSQLFVELGFFSKNGGTAHADFDDVMVDWP